MPFVLLLSFLALAWMPSRVQACGGIASTITLLTDTAGAIPAGTKILKLYVYATKIDPQSSKVILSASGSGLPVTIPVTLRAKMPIVEVDLGDAAIQPALSYSLSVSGSPEIRGASASFSFVGGAVLSMPSELGSLAIDKRASGQMTLEGCDVAEEGEQALIRLVPSGAALPWLRTVKHQLHVDGSPAFEPEIPLINYVTHVHDTVVRAIAHCDRAESAGEVPHERGIQLRLPAGEHSVKWTSTFPDGRTLETPPLALDLRCAEVATPSVQTPPCCKTPPPAGTPSPVGVNVATAVDAGPGSVATTSPAGDGGVISPQPMALADERESVEGCNLGRGQRGGAQALGLFTLLFLLHARVARRRDDSG